VREAIFSILGTGVGGSRVLDLFAGTGALAIEALSRGAASAVLVDVDAALAKANVGGLGLEDRAEVVQADAVRYLRRWRAEFDLIFCDPPYRLADRLEGELDPLLPKHLAPGGRVIVESDSRRPLELGLELATQRRYGDTTVRVYRGEANG
jgi:16S rRNA (guanine(966)-N(2))-methyltransferase RsmD